MEGGGKRRKEDKEKEMGGEREWKGEGREGKKETRKRKWEGRGNEQGGGGKKERREGNERGGGRGGRTTCPSLPSVQKDLYVLLEVQ